nr:YicC/YloC family endoribonuclease [Agathobaculum desmolans]
MMKSMTGYGRAKEERSGRTITVELRAVNHRYLDCTVKAPRQYGFLDDAVKKAAAARIARGKVEVFVGVEVEEGGDVAVTVNHALAERYLAALRELGDDYGLRDDVTVSVLAKLPDVLGSERIEQDADEMIRDVTAVFEAACDGFNQMREREGEKLAEDVRDRCAAIERMVGEVEKRSPERVREYREKLLTRMREVLADTSIDETRILTEAAIYADKTAVDEETVRLRSHLHQLDGMLRETQPVGRKLDFLVQEMNREANTIGSKANDVDMARIVVDIKSEIEKIREQIQNIE